jgi:menaquinone-dependent protoporphyrinogen IX oxidase
MPALAVHASEHGATQGIAERIAQCAKDGLGTAWQAAFA